MLAKCWLRPSAVVVALALPALALPASAASEGFASAAARDAAPIVIAANPQAGPSQPSQQEAKKPERSPEEKMQARFPQPVKVGDLIGLPVLDGRDSTIGYVREVVRTPEGKISLIVPYGKWFGWVSYGGPFDWNRRKVSVPIEVVAILGRQIAALDMERSAFDAAPDWVASRAAPLSSDQMIRIALTRR